MKNITLTFLLLVLSAAAAGQDGAADSAAKYLSGPSFEISAEDEAAGIGGTMKVAITVDKSGKVSRAAVYVGPMWPCSADLDRRVVDVLREAEKAVMQLKFSPAIKDGKPVESQLSVSLKLGKTARDAREAKPPAGEDAQKVPKMIRGGVLNGKARRLEKPAYPSAARAEGASGSVSVQVLIDEEGKIVAAQAIDGSPLLHFAARTAACKSEFSPTTLSGVPVKVSGVITYNFVP